MKLANAVEKIVPMYLPNTMLGKYINVQFVKKINKKALLVRNKKYRYTCLKKKDLGAVVF